MASAGRSVIMEVSKHSPDKVKRNPGWRHSIAALAG